MAESPTHKFGQIIGDLLERSMEVPLRDYTNRNPRLYLDKKGRRAVRGNKRKVAWTDRYGNAHDLDFVIEWDGTQYHIGKPAAFIETAWRRYTKHSRNKVQEIQGAITPLFETYKDDHPFIGVILGGDFTEGSLTQLKSFGFEVLYFNYDTIIDAFAIVGIDAYFEEETPDDVVKTRVDAYNDLSAEQVAEIEERLRINKQEDISRFLTVLERTISRTIERISVVALHGREYQVNNVDEAIRYIENYEIEEELLDLVKFEVFIRYNNGDKIDASFQNKDSAVEFLARYR